MENTPGDILKVLGLPRRIRWGTGLNQKGKREGGEKNQRTNQGLGETIYSF